MELETYLQPEALKDESWELAREAVLRHVTLNSAITRLIRLGWEAQITQPEFIRLIGGTRINVACLLDAAKVMGDGRKPAVEHVIASLNTLGLSYSAVIIAVNLTTRLALKAKPPPLWQSFLKDMMSSIEIGTILGNKIPGFGPSCGALMGFAQFAGPCVALMEDAKAFKEWRFQVNKMGKVGRKIELDLFGYEMYQASALVLQQLGFGIDVALGSAIGLGALHPQHISPGRNILCWKAAIDWIEALKKGRDMPAEPAMREFFPQIAPLQNRSDKNLVLSVLYTEVAKVKSNGSDWTWHLPFPSYEKTQEQWKLQ